MFKSLISVVVLLAVGIPCSLAQTAKPGSPPGTAYLAAVREFSQAIRRLPNGDSTQPFFLEDSVDAGKSYYFFEACLKDTGTFTEAERDQIKRWADHPTFTVWTRDMAPGVQLIPKDTITRVFSAKHRDGWTYFYHHYGPGYHSFGCPLFLRNYTWCLIYTGFHCGWLCGHGQLSLYKKEAGGWVYVKNWGWWDS